MRYSSGRDVAVGVVTVVSGESERDVVLVIGDEASELDDLVDADDLQRQLEAIRGFQSRFAGLTIT